MISVKLRTPAQEFWGFFREIPRPRDHLLLNGARYSVDSILWECIPNDGANNHVTAEPIIYLRQLLPSNSTTQRPLPGEGDVSGGSPRS